MITRLSSRGCCLAALSPLFLLPLSSIADPAAPDFELAPFPVDAHPAGTDEAPSSLSIVTAGDRLFRSRELRDHFLSIPGAHLDQPGGPGGRTTLFLRGAEENHSLVFLDGVPLNDPTNTRGGAVDLSLLGAGSIRQVAVVRGPASVRYGPEALGGVVHLESGLAETAVREVAGGIGAQDYHRLQLRWHEPIHETAAIGLFAGSDADGLKEDGGRHERQFARGSLNWQGPVKVDASGWYAKLDSWSFPDDSGGHRYAAIRTLEERQQEALGGSVRVRRAVGDLLLSLNADVAEFDNAIHSPGVLPGDRDPMGLPGSEEETFFRRARAQFLAESATGTVAWSAGVDAQREIGRSAGALLFGPLVLPTDFDLDRDRFGGFGELTAPLPGEVRMTVGARADKFTDEVWRATLRAGLRGNFRPSTEWRVNAGNAFKPPSFYALANPLVGDPNLRPETSETMEVGLRQTLHERGDFVDLVFFTGRSSDDIDFDPGPPPALINRSDIRRDGVEFAVGWQPWPALALAGSIAYVDARVEESGEDLRGRPEWRGGLRIEWLPVDRLRIDLAAIAVGSVSDTSVPTGAVRLGGWLRLDTSVAWAITPQLDLLAAIDNLLDREYEETIGFTARDRRGRIGLSATF